MAKSFWLSRCDLNTKHFHRVVNSRKKNNTINKLKNQHASWVEKSPELDAIIVEHFNELFKSAPGDLNPVLHCLQPSITTDQMVCYVQQSALMK